MAGLAYREFENQYVGQANLIEANFEADKINAQVVEKIRQKYSINDEIKLLRLGETPEKATWSKYVDDCRAWGTSAKEVIK